MVTIKEASEQYGLTQDTLRYYELVQLELARRKRSPRHTITNSPFPGKIICGDCGEASSQRYGTATASTAELFGEAMQNTRTV